MASKPNTTTTLANARKALAQIEQEADGLVAARDKVLLDGGATSEAIEINKQIDATRRAVEAEQRRVHLLEQKLAEEEREAVARRHEEHVQEFESTLAEADRAGDDLEEAVARLEATFRKTILLRETAFSMWPHGRSAMAMRRRGRRRARRWRVVRFQSSCSTSCIASAQRRYFAAANASKFHCPAGRRNA